MLVVISPGFPANENDSTCLPAVQQMMLAFKDKLGTENFCIISLDYPFTAATYQWQGITVYAVAGKNKNGLKRFYTWFKAWQILNLLRRKNNSISLLAMWLTSASLVAKYYAKLYKLTCAFWVQGQDVKANNKYIPFIRPKANQIISISAYSAKQLELNFKLFPTTVANNGIRAASMPDLNAGLRNIDIIGVGSLIAIKNYKLFVEILADVAKQFPNVRCVHAGEGVLAEVIMHYASSLGVDKQLKFLGNTAHAEVLDLMNHSKVFLHTSEFEGSSTVIAEALYMGCRVVSTVTIADSVIPELKLGTTKTELVNLIITSLTETTAHKRVLVHDLKDSIDIVCEKLKLN